MKLSKKIFLSISSFIGLIILIIVIYVLYVLLQYHRIADNLNILPDNNSNYELSLNTSYKISTYNIGFGAYSQDFSFFLDNGYKNNGEKVKGKFSRAKNKDEVIKNTKGAISTIKKYDADFMLYQEVDTLAHRSHKVNQYNLIKDSFNDYSMLYAENFHTAYLMYPLFKPHGKSNSGIATLSKYKVESAVRKQFTVTDKLIDKLFDLDRCFLASYYKISDTDKYLVILNVHMSAYDEGGKIREQQIKELNDFMKAEVEKGNYVIAGGDFNHDLLTYNPSFKYTKDFLPFKSRFTDLTPPWLSFLFSEEKKTSIDSLFKVIASDNTPTCRTTDDIYKPNQTYVATVDGFIVSSNIEVIRASNILTKTDKYNGFAYSDHDPATMEFILK